jgi:hypothetical protein
MRVVRSDLEIAPEVWLERAVHFEVALRDSQAR